VRLGLGWAVCECAKAWVEKKEDFDRDLDLYPFEAIGADIFGQYLLVHIVLRYCVCVSCCWSGKRGEMTVAGEIPSLFS
jgi:hypothetical protein